MKSTKICFIEGCEKPVWGRGWCRSHHERWRNHGDPLAGRPAPTGKPGGSCAIEGCDTPSICRGLCEKHYGRRKRHGDPLIKKLTGKPNPVGPGVTKDGYRRTQIDGVRETEHTRVAEEMIGRAIRSDEVVHHINGDKLDNRPENLQVMLRAEHQRLHHLQEFCQRGHPMSGDNVYAERRGHRVVRHCKTCSRERMREIPYYGVGWTAARRATLERDGYRCQDCGVKMGQPDVRIEVHHIIPALSFGPARAQEANAITNLLTLCHECHQLRNRKS